MICETQTPSAMLLSAFATEEGGAKWCIQKRLSDSVPIENGAMSLEMGLDGWDEPGVTLDFTHDGHRVEALISSLAKLRFDKEQDAFFDDSSSESDQPKGVTIHVGTDSRFGMRLYIVPDSPDEDVTVAWWTARDPEKGTFGKFAEPIPVDVDQAAVVRKMVIDGLHGAVRLANAAQLAY